MRTYEYRHVIGFEETNLVGNVYYTNHVRWQGRCRELFVREHAPQIIEDFARGLALVTTRCSCEYFAELAAFEEIVVRMRLGSVKQNRITLEFEYWRLRGGSEQLVARGEQQVACMQRQGERLDAVAVPASLMAALQRYGDAALESSSCRN